MAVCSQKAVHHPKYNSYTTAYDLALLVLDKPSKIKPVVLAKKNLRMKKDQWLWVAGWGATESAYSSTKLL